MRAAQEEWRETEGTWGYVEGSGRLHGAGKGSVVPATTQHISGLFPRAQRWNPRLYDLDGENT